MHLAIDARISPNDSNGANPINGANLFNGATPMNGANPINDSNDSESVEVSKSDSSIDSNGALNKGKDSNNFKRILKCTLNYPMKLNVILIRRI